MALGHHSWAVAELSRLAREHPLRERPHALLMRSLREEGRTAEALEVYATFRRRLVEEIGVEPSAELRELHLRLLRAPHNRPAAPPEPASTLSPAPAPGPPTRAARPACTPVPRQLPPVTPLFVGRDNEMRRLDAWREDAAHAVLLVGPAGVGKTALALHWAHRAGRHFSDGQLFLNMRGFAKAEPMTPEEALPLLLQGLGYEQTDIPASFDAQASLYRTVLAERAVMVVLDDVADRGQVLPLLCNSDHSLTVVTSRARLGGLVALDGARRLTCGVLDARESFELLRNAAGAERVDAEAGAATELAALCGHLPLALCIAASCMADEPTGSIAQYVRDLDRLGRLSHLRADGDSSVSVQLALDVSYEALPAGSREAFRLLGVLSGTERSLAAAAAAVGADVDHVRDALGVAARIHLVRRSGPDRIVWHDLIHDYARQRALEEDGEQARAALLRVLDHYLHSAANAAQAAGMHASLDLVAPVPGADPVRFDGRDEALAWFDAEWKDIASAITHVAEHGPRPYAWRLVATVQDFLQHRRPLSDWLRVAETALRAAEQENDPAGRAAMQLSQAHALWRGGSLEAAVPACRRARDLARDAGWEHGEALALKLMGVLVQQQGDPGRASSLYTLSLGML